LKPILEMDKKERQEFFFKGYRDLILFGQGIAPKDFLKNKTPPFHRKEAEVLLDKSVLKMCEIWPRGYSKTTIFAQAFALHSILYQDKDNPEFIVLIGETQAQAMSSLKWIKTRLESPEVQAIWGDLIGTKWTQHEIVTKTGARVLARGTGQAMRGAKEDHMRITAAILDDFESELNTKTEESRRANAEWMTGTVIPALEPKTGRMIALCTIVHEDSWMHNIYKNYEKAIKQGEGFSWYVSFYQSYNEDGPLWADRFPLPFLEERKKEFAEAGQINKFYQEYQNEPISSEERKFAPGDFRYYEGKHSRHNESSILVRIERDKNGDIDKDIQIPVNITVGVDPAISLDRRADRTWILPLATDIDDNTYVLPYFKGRIQVYEIVEKIFEFGELYPDAIFIIETTAYQEALAQQIEQRMRETHKYLRIRRIKPRVKKSVRIDGMQPHFALHKMYMQDNMYDLIHELTYFPDGKHDDGVDALFNAWKFRTKPTIKPFISDVRSEYERLMMPTHISIDNIPDEHKWKVM